MNVLVESQPNCLVTLQVEVPADRVDREWQSVADQFLRNVRIPGYRPGKAPKSVVESRYAKDIKEELTNKLMRESLNEAIREKNIRVLSVSNVENVEIGQDKALRYKATIVTAPDFELPDYSSIPAEIAKEEPNDEIVERWISQLSEPHATYTPVEDRPLAMGDFAVLTYTASFEGKPLAEVAPTAPAQIQGRRNAWVLMDESSLAPGFCDQLVGSNPNDEKTVSITLPDNFPLTELAGKNLDYAVTVHAINTKHVPAFDDELASKIEAGSTAEQLREKIVARLHELSGNQYENAKRQAAIGFLLSKVECDLPASVVEQEMNGILREIVRENQGRGVSDEEITKHQDELVGSAQQSARDRVRTNFLLLRIAEKEKIEVTEQDLTSRVLEMAARFEIPVNKLVKDLQRRDGIGPLREQILAGKALDLITANVTVREPSEAPAEPAQIA